MEARNFIKNIPSILSSLDEDELLYNAAVEAESKYEPYIPIVTTREEDMELYFATEEAEMKDKELNQHGGGGTTTLKRNNQATTPERKRLRLDEIPSTSRQAESAHPLQASTSSLHPPQEPSSSTAAVQDYNIVSDAVSCRICKISILTKNYSKHIMSKAHKNKASKIYIGYPNVSEINTAFGKRIVTYRITALDAPASADPINFLVQNKETIQSLIKENIDMHTALKVNFIIHAKFIQETKGIENEFDFQTLNNVICLGDDLDMIYASVASEISTKFENFEKKDSGWTLKNINYIDVNINKYNPLRGSSFINLPFDINNKKAIINIQNTDTHCFKWAVLSALHPPCHHAERVYHYKRYEDELKFDNISFPMKIKDITKFEKLNNISINVFGLDYDSYSDKNIVVGPYHHTKCRKEKHINLLYITEGNKGHYCFIKNMSRLISAQLSSVKVAKYICDGCLLPFTSIERLKEHNKNDCAHVSIVMPDGKLRKDRFGNETPNNFIKFSNFHNKMEVPFVVYADFESFLTPHEDTKPSAKTRKVNVHEVYSYGYYIKCSYDDSLSKYRSYRGENSAKHFMDSLRADVRIISDHLTTIVPMDTLNSQEEYSFHSATKCHICNQDLNGDSVRDHDHLTGKYRGAAHNNCNINYSLPYYVPCFFHNLSSFDAHFIVRELSTKHGPIELIPENKEKYISFTETLRINQKTFKIRFLDSFKFMSASLDKLSKTVDIQNLTALRTEYPNEDDFKLLIRKGVYPYEYIKSHSHLSSVTSLPDAEHFFNQLTNSAISEDDYNHAKTVWNHFQCKDMGEYSDLYLKTDVLLLTDVFENFRKVCQSTYGLDPSHYFTTPGLTWDAMLKYTNCKLELMTDYDKLAFVKTAIRGGLAQCSNRHGVANNKFMSDYDASKPESYLMYFDANNLYGWAMSQHLPLGNFQWVDTRTDYNVSDTSDTGFILEVDLDYPDSLHDSHSDFPLCPERLSVGDDAVPKLLTTLNNKTKYVIHYRNLKQCLQLGMRLSKIHRILSFDQRPWLKEYVDLNTKLRQQASCDFDKEFFKLMNNSLYGKCLEDQFLRKHVKLVKDWPKNGNTQGAEFLISKPNFHSLNVITENLVVVQLNKLRVVLDKPIYIGFCVLDLSKSLMYDFHYNYMKNKFKNNIKMLYTDTDSLIYHIKTNNFYEDIKEDLDSYFDTSDYDKNNVYNYPLVNKKKLGLFKDENKGRIFREFIGLRAKMYAIAVEDKVSCRAKGVNKCVTKTFRMEDYRKVLMNKESRVSEMMRFRSVNHDIFTEKLTKISLSHNDSKRCMIKDSSDTLAYGHYKLRSV